MFKKTVQYTNFLNEEVEEDLYFHFSETELIEMQFSVEGGLSEKLDKIMSDANGKEIIAFVKNLILDAYGVRSEDGRRFIKDPALTQEFAQTPAFSSVFFELLNGEEAAATFVNALIPKSVAEKVASAAGGPQKPQDRKPKASTTPRPAVRKASPKGDVEK